MQTVETETINAELITRDETSRVATAGNYEPVRFNAMKHGILSRLAVLAHEDHAEFADLLAALMDEHRPTGMTERHLVEELATIIWRKRRVLLAEGAKINESLRSAAASPNSIIQSAAPFERGLTSKDADLREFVDTTPEEIAKRQRDAALDLAATRKAAAILRKGRPNAYTMARRALTQDSRDWWDTHVEDGEHPATAEGFAAFIRDSLDPFCYRWAQEANFTPAIKTQIFGKGLQAHQLENLSRYETHLDRKFERTLAMLLKLKDLRGA